MSSESKQPTEREISSGVIVFKKTPEGPRFLVLYYGHNYWTFPRGKIEKEERAFPAALRETKEETGLSRRDLHLVDYFKAYENWTFERNGKKVRKTVIFYLAETQKRNIRLSDEHWGYAWATYSETLKIFVGPKHRENRKVIKRVHDFLNGPRRAPRPPYRRKPPQKK